MEHAKNIFFIGLLLLLAYFPVASFQYPLVYDNIDSSLAWRFFIGECLQQDLWPLWNPHINYGFPQFAESQTWYPISLLMEAVSRYTLLELNLELFWHVLLAGWGMYTFLKEQKTHPNVAFTLAVVYACSGFFVGNGQHMWWVISGAWIPWVLLSFSRLCKHPKLETALALSLYLFLLLTGGYPAFFVVNGYLLIFWSVLVFGRTFFLVSRRRAFVFLGYLSLTLLGFAGMAAGVVSSGWELSTFISRGQALSIEEINLGSLSFKSLVSFLNPTAVSADSDYWQVLDYGMVNVFFGSFLVVVLGVSLIKRKGKLPATFYVGLFFLLLALGWSTPLLPNLVEVVPFLNQFRFAALYRFFTLFFWLWTLGTLLSRKTIDELPFFKVLVGLVSFHFVTVLLTVFQVGTWPVERSVMSHFLQAHDLAYNILLGAAILFVVTGVGLFLYGKKPQKRILYGVMLTEALVHIIVLGPVHIYNKNSPAPAEKYLESAPKEWPLPNLTEKTISTTDSQMEQVSFLWRNKAHYTKQLAAGGYTPYSFTGLNQLRKREVFQQLLHQPFVFFTNREDLVADTSAIISTLAFTPNRLLLRVSTTTSGVLVFQQNFYPYWEASVAGKPVPILKVKDAFMGVRVSEGENQIEFTFRPKTKLNLILFGQALFWGLLAFLSFRVFRRWLF